jgi:hypothetical protein
MAKLSGLIDELAKLTGLPKGTVQLTARHLREASLLASGGRGPGGAEMGFSDASNLLLALAASQQAKDAPAVVRLLNSATITDRAHRSAAAAIVPDDPIMIRGEELADANFGVTLAEILSMMAEGDVRHRTTEDPFDVSVTVPLTAGLLNARASLQLESSTQRWDYDFRANNPDFHNAPRPDWNKLARERIGNVASMDFQQQTRIGPMVLFGLADFIGGKAAGD